MSEIQRAKDAMRALAVKAKEVVDSTEKTNAEKRTELDNIEAEIKSHADTISLHEQVARLGGSVGASEAPDAGQKDVTGQPIVAKSFGEQLTQSDAYKTAMQIKNAGGQFSTSVELKATANPVDVGSTVSGYGMSGEAGALVTPDFRPGILPILFQPLRIEDLMASGTTTSDVVSYVVESVLNDNSAMTSEKSAYAQSDDTLARVSDQVSKATNLVKMTDEMLQDARQFEAFLNNRLVFTLRRLKESQLLNGTGTYPAIKGLLNRTGLLTTVDSGTAGTPNVAGTPQQTIDAIYTQITNLRSVSFIEPDAIVIHPTDWEAIRLAKDSNLQYYGGGPFTGAYGNSGGFTNVESLWGLPVVITSAATLHVPLVGGFKQNAQVFNRQGITIEMSNSNVDDFQNGLVSVRATERFALAVYRPNAFGTVTILQ